MNRLFRHPLFPLGPQLLSLAAFIALSAAVIRKRVATEFPDAGWRSTALSFIPGIYGGALAIMICAWRLA